MHSPWESPISAHEGAAAPPFPDPAPALRSLAEAVLRRAALDALGETALYRERPKQEAVAAARQWIMAGGAGFEWWAELAGVDPGWLQQALLRRLPAGQAGTRPSQTPMDKEGRGDSGEACRASVGTQLTSWGKMTP